MNHKLLILFCGIVLGGVGSWVIFHSATEASEKKESPAASPGESKERPPGITLTSVQVAQAGIRTEQPRSVKLLEERQGFAQVLDPSTLLNSFAEISLAELNLAASQKEYLRLKELHENGDNASGQAVDGALLTAERDRIQLSSSLAKIKAAWGEWAATETGRQRFAAQLTGGGSLLRIDFAGNEALGAEGKTVLISPAGGNSLTARAEILAPASSLDPQFQGQSYWAVVARPTLPVGGNFEARLTLGESQKDALAVPVSTLLRHESQVFLYVQISPENFLRKNVKILQRIGGDEAVRGVDPTDQVVTVGAQQLLSAEFGTEGSGD